MGVISNADIWIPILLPPNWETNDSFECRIKQQENTSQVPNIMAEDYCLWNSETCSYNVDTPNIRTISPCKWEIIDNKNVSTWFKSECKDIYFNTLNFKINYSII